MLAGLALIFFAVQQVYAAITNRLDLDIEQMRREAGAWAAGLSRFGVAARAVVFALLGWAIVVAGWSRGTSGVGTTTSSLRTIAQQPGALGRWLLGATAAGFVPYGFYEVIHATCTSGASFKFPRNQPRARRIISPVADLAVSVGLCPQLNAIKAKLTS